MVGDAALVSRSWTGTMFDRVQGVGAAARRRGRVAGEVRQVHRDRVSAVRWCVMRLLIGPPAREAGRHGAATRRGATSVVTQRRGCGGMMLGHACPTWTTG